MVTGQVITVCRYHAGKTVTIHVHDTAQQSVTGTAERRRAECEGR
jgi:hypothetical protein